MGKLVSLLALVAVPLLAQDVNWTGPYRPCLNSAELKKTGHLSVGVRYDVSDPVVNDQFHKAFEFWAKLLDADFYDEPSTSCAVAILDGNAVLLKGSTTVARAQFPDRQHFNGWIAIDPAANKYLSDDDAVANWIHEIGHLLGLKHNPSAASLMYHIDCDARSKLDSNDLRALAQLHAFRPIPPIGDRKALISAVWP